MRKGLTQTLLTVAVALLGLNAMAGVPVIGNLPDVIIGNAEDGTGTNLFVFEDALNLDQWVTDDNTTPGQILWSYDGGGNYKINNTTYIGVNDPTNPGSTMSIGANLDPEDVDGNARTITFRNVQYSPVGGTNTAPAFTGIGGSEALTLHASDSTTYSSRQILVYVNNGGNDELSGGSSFEPIRSLDFKTGSQGWSSYTDLAIGGTVTQSQGASGICVSVTAAGVNIGGWQSEPFVAGSAYTTIELAANSVYQVRVGMTTNAAANKCPVWSMVHQQSATAYSGESIYFGNYGDANAPYPLNTASQLPSADRNYYESWITPAAIETPQFNSYFFTGTAGAENGMRLQLRALDVDGGNYDAENDSGQLCWNSLEIRRYDIASLIPTNVYTQTTFALSPADQGSTINPANYTVKDYAPGASTIAIVGGAIKITPVSATSWTTNAPYFEVRAGDDTVNAAVGSTLLDNYPVDWETDALYKVTYQIAASDAAAANNPPDFIFIGMDTPSNELISLSAVTSNYGGNAMPKATAQPYVHFMYGHSRTAATEAYNQRVRPRMEFGCNDSFVFGNNSGGILISGVTVDKLAGRSGIN